MQYVHSVINLQSFMQTTSSGINYKKPKLYYDKCQKYDKINKYKYIVTEWEKKCYHIITVIPLIIGSPGMIKTDTEIHINMIPGKPY